MGGGLSQTLAARQDRALHPWRELHRLVQWKIYVKGGIVTWETQQTDYPRTRPELPNHEPRGCSRGASYSWYLYPRNRREISAGAPTAAQAVARCACHADAGWRLAAIVEDPAKRAAYTAKRGLGGFVRATWDEVTEIIAHRRLLRAHRERPRHSRAADG